MPTPLGHALGGLTAAWTSPCRKSRFVVAWGVVAATAADLDILVNQHRTYTHSVGAVILAGALAWVIARNACVALTIAVAWGTHVLLDWLGSDTAPPLGVQALWPFSSKFYISGANLFMGISRRYWNPDEFILGNLKAVGWELLILGPIAALAWYFGSRRHEEREGTKTSF